MILAAEHAGWLLNDSHAWIVLGIWLVTVVLYGIYRSLGEAEQDHIRPSGPFLK